MTDTTPRAGAPLLAANQAQKNVTHNEALYQFDAMLCARFLDRDLSTPPSSPVDGDTYLIKATATGAWTGQDGKIAYCADGAWRFYAPFAGLAAYVMDESVMIVFNGSAWVGYTTLLTLENLPMLGVNTTANSTNKLAVQSNAALFTDLPTSSGGSGDMRVTLSKQAASNTASLLFQDNFSGRAEIGLCGDDNFHFKVSPDGSAWYDGFDINKADGSVDFLVSETTLASAATTDLGTASSLTVQITGTTAITSFGTSANQMRLVRFAGALTLTQNVTSLILLGGVNRTTAAGDVGIYTSDASGNWHERDYRRAASDPGDAATKSGTETLTNKTLSGATLSGTTALPSGSTIASSGFIGAKTSAPTFSSSILGAAGNIESQGGAGECLTFFSHGTGHYGAVRTYTTATGKLPLQFQQQDSVGLTTVLYVDASQNVGIGNSAPNAKLSVTGNIYPSADNTYNLGSASYRFGTLYAGTGAINTSGEDAKANIRALNDAELAVAQVLAANIRMFQFCDAVAAKGEAAARLHTGMIYEQVVAAFRAQGLDPARYGIVCCNAADENGATKNIVGLRYAELAQFVMAGLAARLSKLEAA